MRKYINLCIILFLVLFYPIYAIPNSNEKNKEEYRLSSTESMTIKDLCLISKTVDKYLLLGLLEDRFGTGIYKLPVTLRYYQKWTRKWGSWVSNEEPVLKEILFTKHELGEGSPGEDNYIVFKTKRLTLPFFTDDDINEALKLFEEEYKARIQQIKRITENRNLNPNKLIYQKLTHLYMQEMGHPATLKPKLESNKIYYADGLEYFQIINRLDNGDYNIAGVYSVSYQFILHMPNGQILDSNAGFLFAESAFLRYLGTMEVIMSNGYVRYLPYFELIEKNPHKNIVHGILEECKKWNYIIEDVESGI